MSEQPVTQITVNPAKDHTHDWGDWSSVAFRPMGEDRGYMAEDTRDQYYTRRCRICGAVERQSTGIF